MAEDAKIIIICPSGLTSAMLATRMNKRAKERGLQIVTDSMPLRRGQGALSDYDVVLLSPGAASFEREFKELAPEVAISPLSMMVYGRLEADRALDQALNLMPLATRNRAEAVDEALEARAAATASGAPRKLIVCCAGGMSSSLLSQKVQDEIRARNLNIEVGWTSVHKLEFEPVEADCILVGPQVSPIVPRLREVYGDATPVALMSMRDYGTMDAKAIVNQALLLMAEHDLSR